MPKFVKHSPQTVNINSVKISGWLYTLTVEAWRWTGVQYRDHVFAKFGASPFIVLVWLFTRRTYQQLVHTVWFDDPPPPPSPFPNRNHPNMVTGGCINVTEYVYMCLKGWFNWLCEHHFCERKHIVVVYVCGIGHFCCCFVCGIGHFFFLSDAAKYVLLLLANCHNLNMLLLICY